MSIVNDVKRLSVMAPAAIVKAERVKNGRILSRAEIKTLRVEISALPNDVKAAILSRANLANDRTALKGVKPVSGSKKSFFVSFFNL